MQQPSPSSRSRYFFLLHAAIPAILALAVLILFESSNLDRNISDWFFDPAVQSFSLHNDWFLEVVMHHWAKYLLVLVAFGALGIFLLSFIRAPLRARRRAALFVLLSMFLGPAAVAGLKAVTNKHCPYDLAIYGGSEPYTRLLERAPPGGRAGECFPGGHASGGFGLMAFYFVWLRQRPRLAHSALIGGFAYGFVLGFGRLMQGAHFLSHNLWAAIVCWYVALVLYRLILYPHDSPEA